MAKYKKRSKLFLLANDLTLILTRIGNNKKIEIVKCKINTQKYNFYFFKQPFWRYNGRLKAIYNSIIKMKNLEINLIKTT